MNNDDWRYETAMEALNTACRQVAIIVGIALTIIVLLITTIAYLLW